MSNLPQTTEKPRRRSAEFRVVMVMLVLAALFAATYSFVTLQWRISKQRADNARMLERLRLTGIGKWLDTCPMRAHIDEVFTGEGSEYCKLTIPPADVAAFLDVVHPGYPRDRRYITDGAHFYTMLRGKDWWRPEDEGRLEVIEFRPPNVENPASQWVVAASEATGNVYLMRIGH